MAAEKLRAVAGGGEPQTKREASALFLRLERGELSVEQYLDARVKEAVAPYSGKLPADRLAWLTGMIREQLETDPVLVERVRQATARMTQAR